MTVMVVQQLKSISTIERAEGLPLRIRHDLIQSQVRNCIREVVNEFQGQWVTVNEVTKLACVKYPDMVPYFSNKSVAEYLKIILRRSEQPDTFYKCVKQASKPIPIPTTGQAQDKIYTSLWEVVGDFNGHWISAHSIAMLASAKFPEIAQFLRPKSTAEYLKFMGLEAKEIKTKLYFCCENP